MYTLHWTTIDWRSQTSKWTTPWFTIATLLFEHEALMTQTNQNSHRIILKISSFQAWFELYAQLYRLYNNMDTFVVHISYVDCIWCIFVYMHCALFVWTLVTSICIENVVVRVNGLDLMRQTVQKSWHQIDSWCVCVCGVVFLMPPTVECMYSH